MCRGFLIAMFDYRRVHTYIHIPMCWLSCAGSTCMFVSIPFYPHGWKLKNTLVFRFIVPWSPYFFGSILILVAWIPILVNSGQIILFHMKLAASYVDSPESWPWFQGSVATALYFAQILSSVRPWHRARPMGDHLEPNWANMERGILLISQLRSTEIALYLMLDRQRMDIVCNTFS